MNLSTRLLRAASLKRAWRQWHWPTPRRRNSRSSRTACVVGAGIVLLLSGGLVASFCSSLALRDPIFHRRVVRFEQRLDSEKREYAVVALGSSRMHNGFRGDVAEEELKNGTGKVGIAFNMSCAGAGPVMGRVQLERLLSRGIRPDHIIIEVFLATMIEENGLPFEALAMTPQRVRQEEVPLVESYGLNGAALREDHRRTWSNPWQELRFEIFERVSLKLIPEDVAVRHARTFDRWGSCPIDPKFVPVAKRIEKFGFMRYLYSRQLAIGEICPHSVRALRDLVDRCHEQGIATTLVLMPEAKGFREIYSPRLIADAMKKLGRLAADSGTMLIDARDWVSDDDFMDGHHLLASGAEVFTRRLCDERLADSLAAPR